MTQNSKTGTGEQLSSHAVTRIGRFLEKFGLITTGLGLALFSVQNEILENHFEFSVDSWVSPSMIYGGAVVAAAGLVLVLAGESQENRDDPSRS